jgi:hypothetical protein
MTQLLLRGCLAALTPRGSPDADILVRTPDGVIAAEVQVKARSGRRGRGWRMSEKHEHIVWPRLFYCFVDFGHETSWPVYVMPCKDVARYLTLSYQEWLAAPGRGGKDHKGWPGRFISPQRPVKGDPDGWMEPYVGRWDLIIGAASDHRGDAPTAGLISPQMPGA